VFSVAGGGEVGGVESEARERKSRSLTGAGLMRGWISAWELGRLCWGGVPFEAQGRRDDSWAWAADLRRMRHIGGFREWKRGQSEGGVPNVATVSSICVMAGSSQGPSTAVGMTKAEGFAGLMRDLRAGEKG